MKRLLFLVFLAATVQANADMTIDEAGDRIHSYLGTDPTGPWRLVVPSFEAILRDNPRNLEVVVGIAQRLSQARFSADFFVHLAMYASKSRLASEEFLVLADDEVRTGAESFYRELTALELLAAQTRDECDAIMLTRPLSR